MCSLAISQLARVMSLQLLRTASSSDNSDFKKVFARFVMVSSHGGDKIRKRVEFGGEEE